jgi:D-arginine dehydrogenase
MTGRAVAVIGAGIVGCLTARELAARDPAAAITVFDRDLVGSGVTRRSAGVSLVKGSSPRTHAMSALSHGYYAALAAEDPTLPIRPVPARLVLLDESDPAGRGYQSARAAQQAIHDELRLPPAGRTWRLEDCHYTDVYGLTQAIAAQARQTQRVRFAESVKVTGLSITSSWVALNTSDGQRAAFDQVVLAPGPWFADPSWRDLLSPLGLRVKKIVAMHLDRPPKPDDELIIFDAEDAFLLPVAHRGHWLFSYTCLEWDVDPDAPPQGLSPEDVEAARACLRPYSPELADACVSGRICCDAYSPDREPVVRALAGTGGRIVFAGGANGSGYRLAPAIAAEAVNLLNDPGSTR